MRAQRRIVFSRLVVVAFVLTILALVVGSSIILDLAALSWFGVVAFVALALYSVSQGYLLDTSLPLLSKRTRLATVAPLYGYQQESADDRYEKSADDRYESSYDGEVFEPDVDEEWARQFPRYRALG
jgi:phosphoglycerol transferase MdoB-like AlkP superfamily enzyme